jgi:integrase
MPNFKLIKRKNSKSWYVQYFNGSYTLYWSTRTPDKALAKKRRDFYAAEVLRLANKPEGGDEPKDVQVASVLGVYMQDHGDDGVRSKATSSMAFRHLSRYFDGKTVADLNLSAFKEHARQQTEAGWAPATLNRVLTVLKAALRHGVKNGDLRSAPYVPMLPVKGGKLRWLTREEAARLLWVCRHPQQSYLAMFIRLGMYTGARHEAILQLTWDRVDLEHGVIDFRLPDEAETAKRRIRGPVSDQLVAMLRRWRKRQLADAKRLGHKKPTHVIMHRGATLQRISDAFGAAVARAGLGADVTPHTLKHSFISWGLRAGISVWDMAGLANTTAATIEKTYGHHAAGRLREVANQAARSSRKQPVL